MSKEYINHIVTTFYEKATIDFQIGYHFRKIQTIKGTHPLKPPIEAFQDHIPRICLFWEMQLLDEVTPPPEVSFNLIKTHKELSIRRGELGRWLILFKEILEKNTENKNLEIKEKWIKSLSRFENIFLSSPNLF